MMDQLILYVFLFSLIVLLGQLFLKSTIPLALILVVSGMLLSFVPFLSSVQLDSDLVLNIFLPLLIYQISSFSSWRDIRKQLKQIASLSVGHVVFITILVAIVIHTLLPQMGWPLAFVLGAIISPPDDVAIVSIGEKIRLPEQIFVLLEGEGMFNDAAALILFRFALAAALLHTFSILHALSTFVLVIVGETLYGILLGHCLGKIRLKITNTTLHMIAGIVTPFFAYVPIVLLGGTGVLATAVVGFLIGNQYSIRFTPEYRLISLSAWPTLAFAIENLIFLLVGLDLHTIIMRISIIPLEKIFLYAGAVIITIILGRFIWISGSAILFYRKNATFKNIFLVSWAGMRGGISLAAALAIPTLYFNIDGVDLRDLIVFLVLCVIIVTLVLQGLTLPFVMKKFGFDKVGQSERYHEHLSELNARLKMIRSAFKWLQLYKKDINQDEKLLKEVEFHINEYQTLLKKYKQRIADHDHKKFHDEKLEARGSTALQRQILKIEQKELLRLWREDKINIRTRNKLLTLLDHHTQRFLV